MHIGGFNAVGEIRADGLHCDEDVLSKLAAAPRVTVKTNKHFLSLQIFHRRKFALTKTKQIGPEISLFVKKNLPDKHVSRFDGNKVFICTYACR
jgi:hypothetical protein